MGTVKGNALSVLFITKRAKLLKNGEAPVYMHTIVNKQVAEVMTGRSIPMGLRNQEKECPKGKDRVATELNHYISTIRAEVLQIHHELEIDNEQVTADMIRDCFYGRDKVRRSLLEVYAEHNEKCWAMIDKEYTALTVAKFDTSVNHLREYIRSCYHRDDIMLSGVDSQFIRDFGFWLKTNKHCQNDSALEHLKILKKVVRIALANDWIKEDPFYGIRFKQEEINMEPLSREELDILMSKEFIIKRLEQVRDTFTFCCPIAPAFADTQQSSRKYLVKDNNGALQMRKARQRASQMCNIPVLPIPQRVLRKYEDNIECIKKGLLLSVISSQRTNFYLKEIADLCGTTRRLTTHAARHATAITIFLDNEVSMENAAKILGHSNIKMVQHHARVLDSSIM